MPAPDPDTNTVRHWGIHQIPHRIVYGDGELHDTVKSRLERRVAETELYSNAPTPEEQFIKIQMRRKHRRLVAAGTGDRLARDYILNVSMPDIADCQGNEMIWRRVKIPGRMTLSALHEKVLVAAMGW